MIEISPSQSFVYSLCCSLLSLTANVLDIPRFLSALASDNARQWGRRTRAIAFPISSMTIKVPILFSQSPVLDLACVTMLSAVGKNSFGYLFFFLRKAFSFLFFWFPYMPFSLHGMGVTPSVFKIRTCMSSFDHTLTRPHAHTRSHVFSTLGFT